ncbi:MAG: mandelate racemase, partial [Actinobacteria bacterium]|nr:mandelate racemase [Actinomycetota bacterium]
MTPAAMAAAARVDVAVERVSVSAFEIPTEEPESDGTLEWDSTT